jgi:hypothetical protein
MAFNAHPSQDPDHDCKASDDGYLSKLNPDIE